MVSLLKYQGGDVNYYNSDATWHALLTIEAYNETPASEHLFLPIVTLGAPDDKGITWGATISDSRGNYYYTSFSWLGFFLPWLFLKVFHLPVTPGSLYLFNTVLFAASAALWALFVRHLYRDGKFAWLLSCVALIAYVLSPELLHGMGIVYWHQSIMQLTLIVQLFAYQRMRESESRAAKCAFYAMALLNPWIEWTGYVANVGFALAELIRHWRANRKRAILRVAALALITLGAFMLFSMHYLLVVEHPRYFLRALQDRFFARNFAASVPLSTLIRGYLKSFGFLWVVLPVLGLWSILRNRGLKLAHGLTLFLVCFPVLENIIMIQHAVEYSYDRMKLILPLSLLICEFARGALESAGNRRRVAAIVLAIVALAGGLNLQPYIGDRSYIWEIDYAASNRALADRIEREYPDSVLACEDCYIRGYMNLLFKRGIYEWIDLDAAKEIAAGKGKRYVVMLRAKEYATGGVYDLAGADICDLRTGEERRLMLGSDGQWNIE